MPVYDESSNYQSKYYRYRIVGNFHVLLYIFFLHISLFLEALFLLFMRSTYADFVAIPNLFNFEIKGD